MKRGLEEVEEELYSVHNPRHLSLYQTVDTIHHRYKIRNQTQALKQDFDEYIKITDEYMASTTSITEMGEEEHERFVNKCAIMWRQKSAIRKDLMEFKMEFINN